MTVRRFDIPKLDTLSNMRLRYMQVVIVLFVVALGGTFVSLQGIGQPDFNPRSLIVQLVGLTGGAWIIWLLWRRNLAAASTLLILVTTFNASAIILTTLIQGDHLMIFSSIFLVLGGIAVLNAATLGGRWLYIISSTVLLASAVLAHVHYRLAAPDANNGGINVQLAVMTVLGIISIASRFFTIASVRLVQETRRTSELLEASAEIGQIISKERELQEMLDRAVELIRDRFAFYHAQIFLVDENRNFANLVASTGEVGKVLLERKHRLEVGSQSVIGRVTQSGEAIVADDTEQNRVHARNELLPNTRSELALPLVDGQKIIGALDVQSTRENAFSATDIQALQVMANQLTTTIRNVLLFIEQDKNVLENKRLLLEAEANLREIQRLNRQLTKTAWTEYQNQNDASSGVTLSGKQLEPYAEWSQSMLEATRRRRAYVDETGSSATIAVPISLRGEILGAIEVEAGEDNQVKEIVEVVQSVAERLAISLDNARLFESAQEATAQEQHLNTVGLRYQAASTIDEMLQITLSELCETLGAESGMIRLGGRPQSNGDTVSQNGGANV